MSEQMTAGPPATIAGRLVLPDRIVQGRLRAGPTIQAIEEHTEAGAAPTRYVLPGFVDTHVHGGGGGDAMDGADGLRTLARFHLRHGTTTLLATTITRPWPEVIAALGAIAAVRAEGVADGAEIAGAHLEGPFISPHRLGAQPPFAVAPAPELVEAVLATGVVRVVTLAPEHPEAAAAARRFAAAGVRVSLGHTTADHDTVRAALAGIRAAGGTAGATHLFNAMEGLGSRAPGAVGAVLDDAHVFAELILDTHHVHPTAFRVARRCLCGRLLLVTDAMRAAGQGDGESELGGHAVRVRDGVARLADGTLAGSVLTLDAALRHAVAHGVPLVEAARLVSANACRYLGLRDRGELVEGLRADLVVLDEDLRVAEVWREGQRLV